MKLCPFCIKDIKDVKVEFDKVVYAEGIKCPRCGRDVHKHEDDAGGKE